MIISRTPFRISFFGGGTDFPGYFTQHGGAVISVTIDKYCYLSVHHLTKFFKHNYRASYSKTESVMKPEEFEHPLIRESLLYVGISEGVEISHVADLPGQTGLGSSSAFTVGLLNSLCAFIKKRTTPEWLARAAIEIERDRVKDAGGWQDQYASAYGGFNRINFQTDREVTVQTVGIAPEALFELESSLMLFYFGSECSAENILREQISRTGENRDRLTKMRQIVDHAEDILQNGKHLDEFGKLLHETWLQKKELSSGISNPAIDEAYEAARKAGAIGGKLLGAGGRGFLCLYAPPDKHAAIREELKALNEVTFHFSEEGSRIIFNSDE